MLAIDDRSAWGISLIRFGVDDILNTTELIGQGNIDYNRISLFNGGLWLYFFVRTQTACSWFSIWCKRESDRKEL
jgi:hypothetical protein